MDSSLVKNITAILLIATCAFIGYYLFAQKDATTLTTENVVSFADVQKYINRGEVLDKVRLDTTIFADPKFNSLQGFPRDEVVKPTGRPNPFDIVQTDGQTLSQ